MKKPTPKHKAVLGYTLYGIFLTITLLYFFFPSDVFRQYLITSVRRVDPRFFLSIKDAHLSLPFGVKFLQSELSLEKNPGIALFSAESLTIRPEIWSFLMGRSSYNFNCDAYGGNLRGQFQFSEKDTALPFSTAIKLKHVRIDDYHYLSSLTGRSSSGILEGAVIYRGLTDGTGEANLKISNGRVELLESFLDLDAIKFDELLIKLVLKNRKIEIPHVKLKGQHLYGTLSGTVRLKNDFLKSDLDLKGTIEVHHTLFENNGGPTDTPEIRKEPLKLPFLIHGTIKEPKLKFT